MESLFCNEVKAFKAASESRGNTYKTIANDIEELVRLTMKLFQVDETSKAAELNKLDKLRETIDSAIKEIRNICAQHQNSRAMHTIISSVDAFSSFYDDKIDADALIKPIWLKNWIEKNILKTEK